MDDKRYAFILHIITLYYSDPQNEYLEIIKRIHEEQMDAARDENLKLRHLLDSKQPASYINDAQIINELETYKLKYIQAVKELELKENELALKNIFMQPDNILNMINEEK